MKALPIGIENFWNIITDDYYYVDKTKIIEELLDNKGGVILFPRPRRFGKTLFMSMLDNFFDVDKKEDNKDLFNGLYIRNTKYKDIQNTYPVINLSFKNLKQSTLDEVVCQYKILLAKLFEDKRYVLECLSDEEKVTYSNYLKKISDIEELKNSLLFLSNCLYKYHKKQVIILIDEYDVPIQKGYLEGFYDEIIDFMRSLLSSTLKTNNSLKLGVLTGVLKVSKESIFSDLNNLKVYSIMDNSYEEYFGFTESETKELLEYYGLSLTHEVKDMYNGYDFGGKAIYNPWSILNYAERKKLDTYWLNTSGNDLIKDLLLKTNGENKVLIEKLVLGESLDFTYNDKITYQDFDDYDNLNTVLNIMFSSGYLTMDKKEYDIVGNLNTYVKIPNNEVKSLIISIMSKLDVKTESIYNDVNIKKFVQVLVTDNRKELEKILNKMFMTLSFMDSQEYFYHAYTLGIFKTMLDSKIYVIKSNREAGSGRFDVMIRKVDNSIGFIIEFKLAKNEEEMENKAVAALNQMKEKEYYKELVLDGIKDIKEMAMVFSGKKVIVR